ncbi:hypothetical protein BDV19DRAFT_362388 [Aspergillus venezuelensis]
MMGGAYLEREFNDLEHVNLGSTYLLFAITCLEGTVAVPSLAVRMTTIIRKPNNRSKHSTKAGIRAVQYGSIIHSRILLEYQVEKSDSVRPFISSIQSSTDRFHCAGHGHFGWQATERLKHLARIEFVIRY